MKYLINYIYIFIIIIFAFVLSSCETDFDVIADYEDVTVVYALFDPDESEHYVKVNKAFLGEGNALIMAQNPDSCNYQLGQLEVKLQEYNNGSMLREIYFDTTTIYNKEAGTFYYPEQVVFKANANLTNSYTYVLVVTNMQTGKEITAETPMVYPVYLKKPNPGASTVDYTSDNPTEIQWLTSKNARVYQFQIRFFYKEIDLTTFDTTNYSIDWKFGTQKSPNLDGGDEMYTSLYGESFFDLLVDNIPVKNNVKRVDNGVEYSVYYAADDLSIYMEMNAPSNSIVQERPQYTNVSNGGVGIVSSRGKSAYNFSLSQDTRFKLVNGTKTAGLNFEYN
jgi:hypothetical protein